MGPLASRQADLLSANLGIGADTVAGSRPGRISFPTCGLNTDTSGRSPPTDSSTLSGARVDGVSSAPTAEPMGLGAAQPCRRGHAQTSSALKGDPLIGLKRPFIVFTQLAMDC